MSGGGDSPLLSLLQLQRVHDRVRSQLKMNMRVALVHVGRSTGHGLRTW